MEKIDRYVGCFDINTSVKLTELQDKIANYLKQDKKKMAGHVITDIYLKAEGSSDDYGNDGYIAVSIYRKETDAELDERIKLVEFRRQQLEKDEKLSVERRAKLQKQEYLRLKAIYEKQ